MVKRRVLIVAVASLTLAACGGSDDAGPTTAAPAAEAAPEAGETASAGIRVVPPAAAAATIAEPPADLVILDVRTQEEFDQGHIEDAVMLDFYRADFADQLAALDRDVPYVIYCHSGNRSGQTRAEMADLGFTTVDDIDGGMVAWQGAGLPLVTP